MDNLTHSLTGALIGQAGLKKKTGLAMPALIIGANLPDMDAACFFWLEGVEHLAFRRGITHGPPALVLLPLVLAGLLWWWDRWQTSAEAARSSACRCISAGFMRSLDRLPDASGARLAECLRHSPAGAVFQPLVLWRRAVHHRRVAVGLLIGACGFRGGGRSAAGLARRRGSRWGFAVYTSSSISRFRNSTDGGTPPLSRRSSPPPLAFWERESIGVGGSGNFFVDGERMGNVPLSPGSGQQRARKASRSTPSCSGAARPYHALEDGRYLLGDARYYGVPMAASALPCPMSVSEPAGS